MAQNGSDYPVAFEVEYPESSSRLLALLGVIFLVKGILLIPHLIIIYFLSIAAFVVMYIGYWAVLITGKIPAGPVQLPGRRAALVAQAQRLVRWSVGPLSAFQHALARTVAGETKNRSLPC